jgi:hypothetical protein
MRLPSARCAWDVVGVVASGVVSALRSDWLRARRPPPLLCRSPRTVPDLHRPALAALVPRNAVEGGRELAAGHVGRVGCGGDVGVSTTRAVLPGRPRARNCRRAGFAHARGEGAPGACAAAAPAAPGRAARPCWRQLHTDASRSGRTSTHRPCTCATFDSGEPRSMVGMQGEYRKQCRFEFWRATPGACQARNASDTRLPQDTRLPAKSRRPPHSITAAAPAQCSARSCVVHAKGHRIFIVDLGRSQSSERTQPQHHDVGAALCRRPRRRVGSDARRNGRRVLLVQREHRRIAVGFA